MYTYIHICIYVFMCIHVNTYIHEQWLHAACLQSCEAVDEKTIASWLSACTKHARAVVGAIARSLARAARVVSFHVVFVANHKERGRESERARERVRKRDQVNPSSVLRGQDTTWEAKEQACVVALFEVGLAQGIAVCIDAYTWGPEALSSYLCRECEWKRVCRTGVWVCTILWMHILLVGMCMCLCIVYCVLCIVYVCMSLSLSFSLWLSLSLSLHAHTWSEHARGVREIAVHALN